ncbi:MAG: hypothetical protein NTW32_08870 [Chloroflexi bacterium]|nr:hypothetical protein [Chloroflexota bacterium]
MNGTFYQRKISKAFPIEGTLTWWEALLLLSTGALAVVLHQSFRLALGLPGYHGIEWMALLIMGRSFSRFKGAGSLASLGAAGMSILPIWGTQHDPFIWLIYFLPGPIMDLAFKYLPHYASKLWFLAILGGLAHITKPIIRLIITLLSGWSFGTFRYGVVYPISSHLLYGMIGGLLGALVVLGIQRISPKPKQ